MFNTNQPVLVFIKIKNFKETKKNFPLLNKLNFLSLNLTGAVQFKVFSWILI